MSEDNVISAFAGRELPPCPMTVTNSTNNLICNHPSLLIDTHDRSIRCAKCNAVLDAFNYLATNGASIQRAWAEARFVRSEIEKLNESVDRLKREEKRLKALVRRLQDKSASRLDVRGGL